MVTESIVILAVCFLLVVALMRSKYARGLVLILPVAVLPVFHLIARGVMHLIKGSFFGIRSVVAVAFVDAIALGVVCALTVVFGMKMIRKSKKARCTYIVMMILYSTIVAWVYIYTTLKPLLG